jgi:hypothetical protein
MDDYHEEVFLEHREFCKNKSQRCKRLYQRKFFYLFTCGYCTSHYVTALFLLLTRFLYQGWLGFVIAEFALVWIANVYMSAYNRLRLEIKAENISIEKQTNAVDREGAFVSSSHQSETYQRTCFLTAVCHCVMAWRLQSREGD